MKNKITPLLCLAWLSFYTSGLIGQEVADADGNLYGTVVIGTQVWLNAGLRTTHFSNGDSIPTTIPASLPIDAELNPIYQWAYNGQDSLAEIYGRLYTWPVAIDSRNVCPVGWHVPSSAEFQVLNDYLGGAAVAGGKLKEVGLEHWAAPNTSASNSTGFNGRANGNRSPSGYFSDLGIVSDNWSTSTGIQGAWDFDLNYNTAATSSYDDPVGFAFAIRCMRDTPAATTLSAISLFPVPAKDELIVDCEGLSSLPFEIHAISGELVLKGELGSGKNKLALTGLAAGVYVIQIQQDQESIELKFVIE